MRKYSIPVSMSVEYFLGDHLGSTSLTTDSAGNKVSEIRYKPFGETRYTWTDSTLNNPANPDDKASPVYALTKYQFTGQFSYESEFGLLFYQSRFYDPALGRFSSPDTIIPGGVQAYDRYAYVRNNPIKFNDPTGHLDENVDDGAGKRGCGLDCFPAHSDGGGGSSGGYKEEKCNVKELIVGAAFVVVPDLLWSAGLIATFIFGTPASAALYAESTEYIMIVSNAAGATMVVHSGCVKFPMENSNEIQQQ